MITNFLLAVTGNLDYKSLCYVITHGEDKEQEQNEEKKKKKTDEREEEEELQHSFCL